MPNKSTVVPERSEQVRVLAHKMWEEEGRPEGRADAHWQLAEQLVVSETGKPAAKKTPPRSKAKKS